MSCAGLGWEASSRAVQSRSLRVPSRGCCSSPRAPLERYVAILLGELFTGARWPTDMHWYGQSLHVHLHVRAQPIRSSCRPDLSHRSSAVGEVNQVSYTRSTLQCSSSAEVVCRYPFQ